MTPHEHLNRARLALDEADRQIGYRVDSGPSRHLRRATAQALVGILEHLTAPPKVTFTVGPTGEEVGRRYVQNILDENFAALADVMARQSVVDEPGAAP